jgi:hypothetical protein
VLLGWRLLKNLAQYKKNNKEMINEKNFYLSDFDIYLLFYLD